MELERRRIGELVALVGVALGLIALFVTTFDVGGEKYSDDGTVLTIGIIIVVLNAGCLLGALLLGKLNLDLTAAVAGAVAFGFFLYLPARVAFKDMGHYSWGAWLGIAAVLVPLGAGAAHFSHKRSDAKAQGVTLWTVAAVAGLVMILIGIWSKVVDVINVTYWNASSSGHALGLLLLLLVIVSAILIAMAVNSRKVETADLALIVSAVTVGLAVAQGVHDAFNNLNHLGTGAWLQLIGGLVLLISLAVSRVVKLPELMK